MTTPPLNERRVVTAMSVDIAGSTRLVSGLDPDDAQLVLDTVFSRIQSAAEGLGGTIVAFTGDGALVVFGWPETSERHADNACRAARLIQSAHALTGPDGHPVRLRVGIASSLVVVRHIAFGLVSRYDVIGDAPHRAAALQKRAPEGGALVCASTQALSAMPPDSPPSMFDLGLRTGPVEAFALAGASSETTADTLALRHRLPILGRYPELARIGALTRARAAGVYALAVIAEPGLGKSRLAAAAAGLARDAQRRIILHECRDLDRTTPFAAARAIIMQVAANADALATAIARAALDASGQAAARAILATEDGGGGHRKASEPATQSSAVRALAHVMLHGALADPALVIVEDLHNIDPESAEVLSVLVTRTQPNSAISLLLTGRPESRETAAAITPDVLDLQPLAPDAASALLARLAPADLGALDVDGLLRRAAGNPFVIAQLLEAHLAGDQDAGGAHLPRTVEALIHARLDRLGPGARQLAQSLGVIGDVIEADIAAAIAGDAGPVGGGGGAAAELERLAFIHPPVLGAIRFRHALIASACASSLTRLRRRDVHEAALAALLRRPGDRTDLYPRLAHHAEEAGQDAAAAGWFWEAARRARSIGASQSLMATFARAMSCCERLGPEGEDRFVDLVLLAFETFHLRGEIALIEPHLRRAASIAAARGRREKACIAQCHRGIAAWYHGRYAEGEAIMRPAFAEAKALGRLPLRFAAQFILAQQLHNQARIDEAVGLVTELAALLAGDLEQARLGAVGLPAAIANAHAGYYLLETDRLTEAEGFIRKGLAIAERGADPYSEALGCIALGRCLLLTGQVAAARACLERGAAIIERQGYDPARLNVSGLLATALSREGRADEAIALAETCLERGLFDRTGSYERHYFLCGFGEALIVAGRTAEGLTRIDAAIDIGRRTSNPCILVQSLSLKAEALRRAGAAPTDIMALEEDAMTLARTHGLAAPRYAFNRV